MKRLLITLIATFVLTAQAAIPVAQVSAAQGSYAALGDSVAAGAGLGTVASPSATDTLCDRSGNAYPHIFARSNGLPLQHLACSGAKADEGIYDSQEVGETIVAQQLDAAFSNGTPEVITMTIGANDLRWSQFVTECLSAIDCDNQASTTAFNSLLVDLKAELNWIMFRVQYHSGQEQPTVLLNGYYNPYSGYDCQDAPSLNAGEYRWLNQRVNSLNNALRQTASKYSFVEYVPVDFDQHGLCSDDSWVQGLRGNEPLHPTAAGQQAIADANTEVYQRIQNGTTEVVEPLSLRERLMDIFSRI